MVYYVKYMSISYQTISEEMLYTFPIRKTQYLLCFIVCIFVSYILDKFQSEQHRVCVCVLPQTKNRFLIIINI